MKYYNTQCVFTSVAGGHQIEDREIKARMELPLVRTVLSTGVSKSSVMKAIEKRLRDTGKKDFLFMGSCIYHFLPWHF